MKDLTKEVRICDEAGIARAPVERLATGEPFSLTEAWSDVQIEGAVLFVLKSNDVHTIAALLGRA